MPLYRGSRRLILRGGSTPIPGVEATTFLARTSGLSTKERDAYVRLINGLVADGTWTIFDILYVLATNNTTTAALNLISTSFGLTTTGSLTFAADVGYTGDGSTGFLNTNWTPVTSAINFTQNSASIGAYIQSTIASSSSVIMGTAAPGSFAYLVPVQSGNLFAEMNGATFPAIVANSNPQGAWVVSRTTSTLTSVYKNGSVSAVGTNGDTSASFASDGAMLLFALNNSGTPGNFTNYQASIFFAGGALLAAQAVSVNNRFNDFMRAVSSNNVY